MKHSIYTLLLVQLLALLSSCGLATAPTVQDGSNIPSAISHFVEHLDPELVGGADRIVTQYVLPHSGPNTPQSIYAGFEEKIEEETESSGKKRSENDKFNTGSHSKDALGDILYDNAVIKSLRHYTFNTITTQCYILFQVYRL